MYRTNPRSNGGHKVRKYTAIIAHNNWKHERIAATWRIWEHIIFLTEQFLAFWHHDGACLSFPPCSTTRVLLIDHCLDCLWIDLSWKSPTHCSLCRPSGLLFLWKNLFQIRKNYTCQLRRLRHRQAWVFSVRSQLAPQMLFWALPKHFGKALIPIRCDSFGFYRPVFICFFCGILKHDFSNFLTTLLFFECSRHYHDNDIISNIDTVKYANWMKHPANSILSFDKPLILHEFPPIIAE